VQAKQEVHQMLDKEDCDRLLDLCARNGVDQIAYHLGHVCSSGSDKRFTRAFQVAFRLMQEPEGTIVQVVKPL
jgi:hypothetical protein